MTPLASTRRGSMRSGPEVEQFVGDERALREVLAPFLGQ
jgi:hypothetical protein